MINNLKSMYYNYKIRKIDEEIRGNYKLMVGLSIFSSRNKGENYLPFVDGAIKDFNDSTPALLQVLREEKSKLIVKLNSLRSAVLK